MVIRKFENYKSELQLRFNKHFNEITQKRGFDLWSKVWKQAHYFTFSIISDYKTFEIYDCSLVSEVIWTVMLTAKLLTFLLTFGTASVSDLFALNESFFNVVSSVC
jgi:hypothetical protein